MGTNNGLNLHGWLIVDKPIGMTSAKVVSLVKRTLDHTLGVFKVGHAGTLDPLASGLLPLALGEATKTVPYALSSRKSYTFTIQWGEQRNTDDAEGKVIATSSNRPTEEEIKKVLPQFIGQIQQTPPIFSAIKVQGQRAYTRARSQENFSLPPRLVYIEDLQLHSLESKDYAKFIVVCHKGTYIRSLARDLAHCLKTVGHVSQLRRTQVGRFQESTSISLEKVIELGHNLLLKGVIHPLEAMLDDIPAIQLHPIQGQKIVQGQTLRGFAQDHLEGIVLCTSLERVPLALAMVKEGFMKPIRVFNMNI